jgi:hypothetical protein
LELEGTFYLLTSSYTVSAKLSGLNPDFPRNLICIHGKFFYVSSLSVAQPKTAVINSLVIPRSTDHFNAYGGNPGFHCLLTLEFIAFEWESLLIRFDPMSFEQCRSLKSICIPASTEIICKHAFIGCVSLDCLTFEPDSQLIRIEESAFYACHMPLVELPPLVERISVDCFNECDCLRLMILDPDSNLSRIGAKAFWNCPALCSLCIPATIRVLRSYSLNGLYGLTSLTFAPDSQLTRLESNALANCLRLQSVSLPASVEVLGPKCFAGSGLSILTFAPDSQLRRIDRRAFFQCSLLLSVCIPSGTEILCSGCFQDCTSLSTLTFEPDSKLTRIEDKAFRNCSSLRAISLPSSLEAIDGSALAGTAIAQITVGDGNPHFTVSGDFLRDAAGISVIRYFGSDAEVTLAGDVEILGPWCFAYSGALTALHFEPGSKLTQIGASAIRGCPALRSISLPPSVELIGDSAFADTGINAESDFLVLGTSLIRYLAPGPEPIVASEIEQIAGGCFRGCAISSVNFEAGSKLTRIGSKALFGCVALRAICIPATVLSLDDRCFLKCRSLVSVTFAPASKLGSIGAKAFAQCAALDTITIPRSVRSLGRSAFAAHHQFNDHRFSIVFEAGSQISRLAAKTFFRLDLRHICVPAAVEVICERCFWECTELEAVTFARGSRLSRIEPRAFAGCSALAAIRFPAGLEVIGRKCFADFAAISEVAFEPGAKLAAIEAKAFRGSDLKAIRIPASLQVIGRYCFAECGSLAKLSFELGSRLRRIEAGAFAMCVLKMIAIPPGIRALERDWAMGSALQVVMFQSARSLRRMIESGQADLRGDYTIWIMRRDCELDFPGFSVQIGTFTQVELLRNG